MLGLWGLMQGIILLIMAFKGGGWGAGILGVVAIIFGLILMGEYGSLGSGLVMIWVAAFWGLIGGVLMIDPGVPAAEGLRFVGSFHPDL